MGVWKKVNVEGTLFSIAEGNRAGRIEKDGGQYEAKLGRQRGKPPHLYWTWRVIGRFATVDEAKAAIAERLPTLSEGGPERTFVKDPKGEGRP